MTLYGATYSPWNANPYRVTPGGAGDTLESLLAEARVGLDAIEAEVRRLSIEVFELRAGNFIALGPLGPLLDPFGIEERAASYEGFILQLERFVTDVFNRVEAKAEAGDLAAAQRLAEATRNILGAAKGSSPVRELTADAKQTVKTSLQELEELVDKLIKAGGVALAAWVAINLLQLLRGR